MTESVVKTPMTIGELRCFISGRWTLDEILNALERTNITASQKEQIGGILFRFEAQDFDDTKTRLLMLEQIPPDGSEERMLIAPQSTTPTRIQSQRVEEYRYDYSKIDSGLCSLVQRCTSEIRMLVRRSTQDIIDIGRHLIAVKEYLPHGEFLPWIETEFEWSERTAKRFMSVAEAFGTKCRNVTDLDTVSKSVTVTDLDAMSRLDQNALYLLASRTTPVAARSEALKRAESGEVITHAKAKEIVSEAKKNASSPGKPVDPPRASVQSVQAAKVPETPKPPPSREITSVEMECTADWPTGKIITVIYDVIYGYGEPAPEPVRQKDHGIANVCYDAIGRLASVDVHKACTSEDIQALPIPEQLKGFILATLPGAWIIERKQPPESEGEGE